MNIAKKVVGCIGSLLIVAVVGSNSQVLAASESKIGVIDVNKVVSTSTAGQKAMGVLDEKKKSLQPAFKKYEDELVAMQKDFEKKNSAWTDAVKKEKAAAFQKKQGEFAAKREEANLELKKLQEQHATPVLKKIEEIAAKVAKDDGYSIILPRQVVLYTSDAADISDKVTSELNKAMK